MGDVEALGLLKIDFLGLRNLDVIDEAVRIIDDGLDITAIPLDDKSTYEMLARGETAGVFQFESSGMREALRQVKPTEFEDLIALVALYRPGRWRTSRSTPGARRAGAVSFVDPRLGALTGRVRHLHLPGAVHGDRKQLAGFSPAEADDLRKAIGKKIHALMASLKDKFLDGGRRRAGAAGRRGPVGRHGEGAGLLLQQVARRVLRADRVPHRIPARALPGEYMAALISSVMNTKDRVPFYVNACDEMGIEVDAAGRELLPGRLRRRRRTHQLWPQRGQERGGGRGAAIVAARGRVARTSRSGTSPSGSIRSS